MISLASLGRPALLVALAFAVAGGLASAIGGATGRGSWVQSGRRSLVASAAFTVVAFVALATGVLAHDFSLAYVADYSSRSLEGPYALAAVWAGMEGSLLLWATLLAIFTAAALTRFRSPHQRVSAWAAAVLAGIASFFLVLLVAPADPFARLASIPSDGSGLNPLLQSPGMLVHPPLLYTGFVGFSIPFAFAMGALLSGRTDDAWFTFTRRWTLFAWSALSIGIVLGGAWAYTELGWGGYWAWDPVENASFLPWLTATAFLHSVVIQEKRRMFKVWNVCLILLTYALAVFGTFLTRSGILSSIHTFTEGPIGKWFLPFLAVMLIGGLAVVAWRLDSLKSENRFDSLLSRESAFLANNVLFLGAAVAILWGTLYPIVAEAVTGVRLAVGPPFFNRVFLPIGLVLLALTGIGPLLSWRRMSAPAFRRISRGPLAAAAVTMLGLVAFGVDSPGALIAFSLCSFTATAVLGEFVRGSRVHRTREDLAWRAALGRTFGRNRRRYGGYVVHLGVVLMVVGFAGAAFKTERQALLQVGDSMRLADYSLTYTGRQTSSTPEKEIYEAQIAVAHDGHEVGTLRPQRNFHIAQEQPQSEVAIRTNPVEDLYVVVTSFDRDGAAAVRAFVNPLTWWIWLGAAVMASGMAIVMGGAQTAPATSRVRATVTEPAVATR